MKGKLASVLFVAGAALGWAQVPPNDYFTNRTVLVGSAFSFTADTAGATADDFHEPGYEFGGLHSGGQPSLWWSWTPTQTTVVIVERTDSFSRVNGYVSVYAATNSSDYPSINQIAGIYLWNRGQYSVFKAEAGTEYQICVGAWNSDTLHFQFYATNAPVFRLHPGHGQSLPGKVFSLRPRRLV